MNRQDKINEAVKAAVAQRKAENEIFLDVFQSVLKDTVARNKAKRRLENTMLWREAVNAKYANEYRERLIKERLKWAYLSQPVLSEHLDAAVTAMKAEAGDRFRVEGDEVTLMNPPVRKKGQEAEEAVPDTSLETFAAEWARKHQSLCKDTLAVGSGLAPGHFPGRWEDE